jgi:hypothetical protein
MGGSSPGWDEGGAATAVRNGLAQDLEEVSR